MRTRNVSEYMLVLALCLVLTVFALAWNSSCHIQTTGCFQIYPLLRETIHLWSKEEFCISQGIFQEQWINSLYVKFVQNSVYQKLVKSVHYACSDLRKVVFLALSVAFLSVYDPLNIFAPDSQGGHVCCLARTSLKFKVTRDKKTIF